MDVNAVPAYDAPAYTPPTPVSAPAPAPAPEAPPQPAVSAKPPVGQVHAPAESIEGHDVKQERKSLEDLDKAVKQINKSIDSFHRYMKISVHEKTNRIMVKVMDTENNQVIREIPPEKALDAFARVLELAGIFMDYKQ